MAAISILKNPTPKLVALISSSIFAFSTLLVFIICKILYAGMPGWLIVIVATILVFAIGYIVVYILVERFIYRKIKLIYKSISDTKLSTKDTPLKSNVKNVNLIDDAEVAVLNWQKSKTSELNKQKKLDKYRKEFLGNVFHELKTPLFNIQGYLETLIEGGIYDEKINLKFTKKARKNVNRMARIVEDLQMIANLQDASFVLTAEKFDITDLVRDVIESLEVRAKKKKNKLEIKEGCNQSFTVIADREMIHQVLSNLIINALKYGKENGKTQIGLYDMNENVLIEVSDNGIGMEKINYPAFLKGFIVLTGIARVN